MNLVKKILYKLPLGFRLYCREHIGLKRPLKLYKNYRELYKVYKEYCNEKSEGLAIKDDVTIWYKSFKRFIMAQPNDAEVAFEFFNSNIRVKKLTNIMLESNDVTLICLVKNDLYKIKKLLEHHRKIGIKHFAILDNGSIDGTLEYLSKQKDVDLFLVWDKYSTNKREAWINRLIAYYGLKRWYLIVDSDELFVYFNMESKKINSLVEYCRRHSMYRVRSVMIDMYKNGLTNFQKGEKNYFDEYKFFDLDTYRYEDRDVLDLIVGGPRGRLFKRDPWLTKYPLIFFEEGDIQGRSHFLFPYKKNKNTPCCVALLHYKFLPNDIQKYREIATDGNYFNGSIQYKEYIEYIDRNKRLSFMYDKSQEFIDTHSLYKIPILEKIVL